MIIRPSFSRPLLEISRLEFEQLLQLIRDLTVRVHRLETLVHVAAPAFAPAPAPPRPPPRGPPAHPPRHPAPPPPQSPPPTPPVDATLSAATERPDLEKRI